MDITFLQDPHVWAGMADEWNALLARSAVNLPFLRAEFLAAWWKTLGGGEWADGELRIALGRDAGGRLQAAAPFFHSPSRPGTLQFLGTSEIADYLDVLSPEGEHPAFAASLMEAIESGRPDGIGSLDLWNILEGSPALAAFEAEAQRRSWTCERRRLKPAPIVGLGDGWEGYLSRLAKKQRHELRRKMRRAAEHPEGAAYVRAPAGDELSSYVDDLLHLMSTDDAKARFLTGPMREAFHDVAAAASAHGWLRLEFLEIGGRPAAGYMCFEYGNRLWIYNSGLDPQFLGLSPGWALLGHLIRSAAGAGRTEVDFMRGEEEYKIRLGGVVRHVERLTLTRA